MNKKMLQIDKVNWADTFPFCPETSVELSNNHETLFLTFRVKGEQVRAVTTEDQGPVWEDSCVEFFCRVPGEKRYFNFETNCIGAMVASHRVSRGEDIVRLTPEEMSRIRRHCTYPREAVEASSPCDWEVSLEIPLSLIFRNRQPVFPQPLEANFYKCGDKTPQPHYVSWQPIPLPKPDFHRPEFFGEIMLE